MSTNRPTARITDPARKQAFLDAICFTHDGRSIPVGMYLLGNFTADGKLTDQDITAEAIHAALAGLKTLNHPTLGPISEGQIAEAEAGIMQSFAEYAAPNGPAVAPRNTGDKRRMGI